MLSTRIHASLSVTGAIALTLSIPSVSLAQAPAVDPPAAGESIQSAESPATTPAPASAESDAVVAPEGPVTATNQSTTPASTADTGKPPRTGRGMLITGGVFSALGTVNGVLCGTQVGGLITCGIGVVQLGVGLGLMLGGRKRARKYAEWKAKHALAAIPTIPNARTGAPVGLNLSLRF